MLKIENIYYKFVSKSARSLNLIPETINLNSNTLLGQEPRPVLPTNVKTTMCIPKQQRYKPLVILPRS